MTGYDPRSALVKRLGPVQVELSPDEGGRLDRLRYDDVDLVLPPGRVVGFHGDTFWPSPQSRWDWPPPPVLDSGRYEVLADSASGVTMLSAADPSVGLQVRKQVTLVGHGLDLEFHVTNTSASPNAVAPWQVTRAPRTGLVVWATGEPFTDEDRLVKQREDPGCWYVHARAWARFPGLLLHGAHSAVEVGQVDRVAKLFADARGWLAHVHDARLFLRLFPDLSPQQAAPRQGEVELFVSPERDYIELENQGAYETLQPGQSLAYAVRWRFASVDPDMPTDRITPDLLDAIGALQSGG